MALVTCRECAKTISDQAVVCPSCGAPGPKAAPARATGGSSNLLGALLALGVIAACGWFLLRTFVGERAADSLVATVVKAPVDLKDEIISVGAGRSQGIPITLPYAGEVELQVAIVKGEHVNVYVIDGAAWDEFSRAQAALFGGKFHHYPAFAATAASQVRRSGRLDQGTYYVVIENPTLGILVPASFDVAVKAKLRP